MRAARYPTIQGVEIDGQDPASWCEPEHSTSFRSNRWSISQVLQREGRVGSQRHGWSSAARDTVRRRRVTFEFSACTEDEARAIIMRSPSKSCSLDPIPTTILKECIDDLLPFLTVKCNTSLLEGHLPVSQRHAIITPLIKKSNLDTTDVKNYRPVSNLTFLYKVVERLVSELLVGFLQENNLMPVEQSAYRKHHSTQIALLRVISDLHSSMDKQEVFCT